MDRFDKRKQLIIDTIANTEGYTTGRTLSLLLNLSVRTVQLEISAINRVQPLIESCNRGYSINRTNYLKLRQQISETDITDEHGILRPLPDRRAGGDFLSEYHDHGAKAEKLPPNFGKI